MRGIYWVGMAAALLAMLLSIGELRANENETVERYPLLVDPGFSSRSGATLVGSGLRVSHRGFDEATEYFASSETSETGALPVELARCVLFDIPLAALAITAQHEAFGHAARAREYGLDHQVHIAVPPPYGWRVDNNRVVWKTDGSDPLHPDRKTALITEGRESEVLLVREILHHSALSDNWRRGTSPVVWIHALGDMVRSAREGTDHWKFRDRLAERPDAGDANGFAVFVRWGLDPLLSWSVYEYVRGMLDPGADTSLPAIQLGETRLLGTPAMRLSNWGHEYGMRWLVWGANLLTEVELLVGPRDGVPSLAMSVGATREDPRGIFDVGARIEPWLQPPLLRPAPEQTASPRPGILAEVEGTVHLTRHLGISGTAAVKTRGYSPGYPLDRGASAMAGVVFSL